MLGETGIYHERIDRQKNQRYYNSHVLDMNSENNVTLRDSIHFTVSHDTFLVLREFKLLQYQWFQALWYKHLILMKSETDFI